MMKAQQLKRAAILIGSLILAACAPKGPQGGSFNVGVVGGTVVKSGALLKQVALLDQRCSATFIDRRIVLTAAHCFPDRNVTTGVIRFTDDGTNATFETKYDAVTIHPAVDPYFNTSAHDLALLRTVDPLPQNFVITPLAQKMTAPKSVTTAAGRGATFYPEQIGPHGALDHLVRTVDFKNLKLNRTSVGAWYVVKIDVTAGVSNGDSGGPLFAMEDGVQKQIGVASTIKDSQTGEDVAYTSVVLNADWIQSASAALLQDR